MKIYLLLIAKRNLFGRCLVLLIDHFHSLIVLSTKRNLITEILNILDISTYNRLT